jgi:phospholipase C
MRYPGSASENLNYYDQFNPEFKEKYEQLETIVGKVIGGKLIFKLGRHKYEYNLQSVKDLSLTS